MEGTKRGVRARLGGAGQCMVVSLKWRSASFHRTDWNEGGIWAKQPQENHDKNCSALSFSPLAMKKNEEKEKGLVGRVWLGWVQLLRRGWYARLKAG